MKRIKTKIPQKPHVPGRRVFYHRDLAKTSIYRLAYRDDNDEVVYLNFWQRLMFKWFKRNPK